VTARARQLTTISAAASLACAGMLAPSLTSSAAAKPAPAIKHVLLISVDGMHENDLQRFVSRHPHSTLAQLTRRGVDYTKARTPIPSDSFPGMVAQATGGDPRTTGVYYDVTFNHRLLAPGTTNCASAAAGTQVAYDESVDRDSTSIDAGQGLSGLPGSILKMTGNPRQLINPAGLPVDPSTCRPVYPHNYLKVNTVFNVARAHGLRTAWSDKHPAYEILSGPSGNGIQDLFTPEINSDAPARYLDPTGKPGDWTTNNFATRQYDHYKVEAVRNEIDGLDHSGTKHVGVPAIFGLNFQTISTAEKLPVSTNPATGKTFVGGYRADGAPGPLMRSSLRWLDGQLGQLVGALQRRGLMKSTAIILSAKHGQSPENPAALTRIDDGTIIDGLNAAWRAAGHGSDLVAFSTDDDVLQLWLTDRSQSAAHFAAHYLRSHSASGTTYNSGDPASAGPSRVLRHSGLRVVYAGHRAASFFGVGDSDPRHPDVFGVVQHGVVFTGGVAKIAEHGGADPQDRDVPLLVTAPGHGSGSRVNRPVETTQIAPTILRLLGIAPRQLQAVRLQGTRVLPAG
jgi:hypothetical protein